MVTTTLQLNSPTQREGNKQRNSRRACAEDNNIPLDEERDGTENSGGEHEAVGDEDAGVHTIVERELDADLQRREEQLQRHHGRRWLGSLHGSSRSSPRGV